jgi:basic membrane protein A
MRKQLVVVLALLVVLSLVAAQCAAPATQEPAAETAEYKLAVVLPGVTTDADYNTLGYLGGLAVQKDLGVEMAYSESVAVPDVDRVMREYIDNGYNIIFTHGSQFVSQTWTETSTFLSMPSVPQPPSKVRLARLATSAG